MATIDQRGAHGFLARYTSPGRFFVRRSHRGLSSPCPALELGNGLVRPATHALQLFGKDSLQVGPVPALKELPLEIIVPLVGGAAGPP